MPPMTRRSFAAAILVVSACAPSEILVVPTRAPAEARATTQPAAPVAPSAADPVQGEPRDWNDQERAEVLQAIDRVAAERAKVNLELQALEQGKECKLSEPRRSDDACANDSDCGLSTPCHAAACVAKSKSHPKQPSQICAPGIDCESADVNHCTCLEGRCALVPD
jgi:hypothetical protein